MASAPQPDPAGAPVLARVARRRRETYDSWTLELEPAAAAGLPDHAPGQFAMLYVLGIGEVPISASGGGGEPLLLSVRVVGAVTKAVCGSRPGTVLGVRGPLGNGWPVEAARGADVVAVAGGIGLAPVFPAVRYALSRPGEYGEIVLLYGSRTPADLLYRRQLERWQARAPLQVGVTVDSAGAEWRGKFDPAATVAFVCGPEIMMRYAAEALLERGVPAGRIYVSLERNMRCGLGHCGHCQLGPALICRDGPVYAYDEIARLLEVREL
jgi:NAD(P)H-flavin reductase